MCLIWYNDLSGLNLGESALSQGELTPAHNMASYFYEHDCEPLGEGEQPNHLLHMARWVN